MRWLWLVSVGTTDIQFPAWSQDETGSWSVLQRADIGRPPDLRKVHEELLWLAEVPDRVRLRSDLPPPRRVPSEPSLEILHLEDGGEVSYWSKWQRPDLAGDFRAQRSFRISPSGEELPNDHDKALDLYFPKVGPMVRTLAGARGNAPVIAIVLSTNRSVGAEAKREPIAAGPLVAQFVAQELHLQRLHGGASLPQCLPDNSCTWLDVLQGGETLEDPETEARVLVRINSVLDTLAFQPGDRVIISTSGGLPPLKPILERVPATRVGAAVVSLLDNPEGVRGNPALRPLVDKWSDREMLRFHCAEALREGDLASAYGLARRRQSAEWARAVLGCVGPLIEMPAAPGYCEVVAALEPVALRASRVEAALMMGDCSQAVRHLQTFLESALWTILRRTAVLGEMGIEVSEDEDVLYGNAPLPEGLDAMFSARQRRPDEHLLKNESLYRGELVQWLVAREGDERLASALKAFSRVVDAYRERSGATMPDLRRPGKSKPVPDGLGDLRNALSHGAGVAVDPAQVRRRLLDGRLVSGLAGRFGSNFLAVSEVSSLVWALREADELPLAQAVALALDQTLNAVIRGEA